MMKHLNNFPLHLSYLYDSKTHPFFSSQLRRIGFGWFGYRQWCYFRLVRESQQSTVDASGLGVWFRLDSIMICFSFYMALLWPKLENKNMLLIHFALQWILNVAWNPVFFSWHQTKFALVLIVAFTLLIAYFLYTYWPALKLKSLLLLPYFLWLLIATSLNAFIVIKN